MWFGIATLTVGLLLIGLADAIFLPVDEDVNGVISGKLCHYFSLYFFIPMSL